MTEDDPLAGLDDVPWADLQHSYGSASDVPGLLRAIQTGTQEGSYPPAVLLAGSIVHQGTRSEATVYTVPFLVRMALDARVPDRRRIVGLLVSIAIGLDHEYLPNGYDPAVDGRDLVMAREEADWFAQRIAEAENDEQRKEREAEWADLLGRAEVPMQCYYAVRESLPDLTELLNADQAELRAETANLLAWFPDFAATSGPLLTSFVAGEAAPGAAATGLVALGLLGEPTTVPFIRRYLDSAHAELRWASAFALTRFGATDAAVVDALKEAVVQPPTRSAEMTFLGGDHRGLATMALVDTPAATTPEAIDAMLTGWASCTGFESYFMEAALFELVFPADPPETPPSFSDLNQTQQRVISFVAEREPSAWSAPAGDVLWAWKIPTHRGGMREYVALDSREG